MRGVLVPGRRISCPIEVIPHIYKVQVFPAAGNDRVSFAGDVPPDLFNLVVDGGPGNDAIYGSPFNDQLSGGDGAPSWTVERESTC